jgi:hypothetical protein
MCARTLRRLGRLSCVIITAACGCEEPGPRSTTRPSSRPFGPPVPEASAGSTSVRPDDRSWRPGAGRLDETLVRRHGLAPPVIRQAGLGQTILWETFAAAEGNTVPGWNAFGQPLVVIRNDPIQGRYLLLSGSVRDGQHGIERRLPAADIAGRVVRIQAKTYQPNPAPTDKLTLPRVRLEWREGDKQGQAVVPLQPYLSPGWETCETRAAIPGGIREIKVVISNDSPAPSLGLDDVLVERLDPLIECRVAGTFSLQENLIAGGDFEVGQRNFSVSGDRRVFPRGAMRAVAQAWSFDETTAAVGKRSLRIPLDQDEFRVAFGWVRVQPGRDYVVSLHAKSDIKMVLCVGVVEYPGSFRFEYFAIDDHFRRMALTVPTRPDLPWSALAVAIRSSNQAKDAYAKDPNHFLWLDGVSLTPGEPRSKYDPPAAVEVGIVGPDPDPVDIGGLIQIGKPVELAVRLANYQPMAYEGQLAVDLVDAFDRPAGFQQTYRVRGDSGKTVEQKIGPLNLPRGYYKLLATAWPVRIGEGQPLSTSERAFAVVNLADAVPTGNYFGMTVETPRMSRRITQLGAGWVWLKASRQWCQTPAGDLDWTWHQDLVKKARDQRLEVLADLAWDMGEGRPPEPGDAWRKVCYEFAQASKDKEVLALGVLDRPNLAGLTPGKYLELMGQASAEFRRANDKAAVVAPVQGVANPDRFAWLKDAMKGGLDRSADIVGVRFPPTDLPEDLEPALEEIRSWRKTYPFKQYIDVGVGGLIPSAYLHVPNLYGYDPAIPGQGPDVEDPVLQAARLVRALAIRQFAMIDRAAWWVESHRPPDILRPTFDPQCHEYDNAPRPVLAAFDYMAETLNPTSLTEWIDLPQQVRALCFEHPGGEMVVLLWRPFGLSLRPVVLKGLAGKVKVTDLFGRHEDHPTQGGDLLVLVNEAVRYVLVPATFKAHALDTLHKPVNPTTAPIGG